MGLFDLFKKKRTVKEVSFQITAKATAPPPLDYKPEPLDRLTSDGELPYGWIYANRDFVEKTEKAYSIFLDLWIEEKKKGVMNEYSSLKTLVTYMEDTKKICALWLHVLMI